LDSSTWTLRRGCRATREYTGYAKIITWDATMTRDATRTRENEDELDQIINYSFGGSLLKPGSP
jgi:hypothetical protein